MPALCPRINIELTDADLDADLDADMRRTGVGSLAQILCDLDELAALGAECVVLDTYTGRPEGRRPAIDDWRMLDTVAARWHAPR